jgi:uncharacterized damage-inducible protein DinB
VSRREIVTVEFLLDQLERGHSGDPWHGPSRASLLEDLTAAEARWTPPSGVHSIWQLVLHMTAWTREVTRRVRAGEARDPEMGDWPPLPSPADATAWRAAVRALNDAHVELRESVRALDATRLTTTVGDMRDRALGTGVSVAQTINGLVQHDAYHCGQIAVVKRLHRGAS